MLYRLHTSVYYRHSQVKVMPTKNNSDPRIPGERKDEDDEIEIPPTGEATVETHEKPPPAPAGKTIHPRRPLPPVPDSDRPDED